MKILVLGCGSIGSRHAKNLKSLGIKNLILCDADSKKVKLLGKSLSIKHQFNDYKLAVKENKDIKAAIICTPSSFHIEPAIFFAKNKINLFIEKPLSNNLKGVKGLSKLSSKNNLFVMMGHAYMFEKGFIKLKSLLEKNTIGDVYNATYLQGQYLPDWHPWADYRHEYTANKKLGGGALLTLTSHTFYVIEWLFGRIQKIDGSSIGKRGPLNVDTDDNVFLLMKTKNNITVMTRNDFIVRVHQHKIIIEGEKGRIEYDFVEQQIKLFKHGKQIKIIDVSIDNNVRFKNEMKYFLNNMEQKSISNNLNLSSGIRFLEITKKLK